MKKYVIHPLGLLLWATCILLNTTVFSQSGSDIFLQIKGARQGDMKGSVTEKGKEGAIKIATCQNPNLSPRDAASGQATGKRQHSPITITKEIDKASPLLMKAFSDKENLPEVSLTYYRTGKKGGSEKWYTVTMKEVLISSLKSPSDGKNQPKEEISFTFQKIEWSWFDGESAAASDRSSSGN